ncbi:hypothetical protein L3X38_017372 [Prunus dulcis]|uniref:Uncharacterized protein n=1 Tax=Prunus dulcis TaxID=3755 RepID=A0AAD4W9L3_PRUDU|nr:hypothetical protein L3X38_017372 [Prunus dulcis]
MCRAARSSPSPCLLAPTQLVWDLLNYLQVGVGTVRVEMMHLMSGRKGIRIVAGLSRKATWLQAGSSQGTIGRDVYFSLKDVQQQGGSSHGTMRWRDYFSREDMQ